VAFGDDPFYVNMVVFDQGFEEFFGEVGWDVF
jgi:hypothetical protein